MYDVVYFDCFSGVAGDMMLASMFDAGLSSIEWESRMKNLLPTISSEWKLVTTRVQRSSISATHVDIVVLKEEEDKSRAITSSMSRRRLVSEIKKLASPQFMNTYDVSSTASHGVLSRLYNSLVSNNNSTITSNVKIKHHHHDHDRTYATIRKLLQDSELPLRVVELSIQVFHEIAKAESHIHSVPISEVHFHEVGAVDSIVDTVGVILGLDMMMKRGIKCVVRASALPLSSGIVKTRHGFLPVPCPATLKLLEDFPTVPAPCGVRGELVTPTGAALLRVLCQEGEVGTSLPVNFRLQISGYGAGTKDFITHPNVLRVMFGTIGVGVEKNSYSKKSLTMLETNIDDMSPQILAHVSEILLNRHGALDVWMCPVMMKKGRVGQTLHVLCERGRVGELVNVMFRETTTLGIRKRDVERYALHREFKSVSTKYGDVRVKIGKLGDEIVNVHPEYEDCKLLANRNHVPVSEIFKLVEREYSTSSSKE